jgi:hypothetical protein
MNTGYIQMAVRKRHKTSLTNHMTSKEQDSLLTMGFCMGFIFTGFMHMWEDSRLAMFFGTTVHWIEQTSRDQLVNKM